MATEGVITPAARSRRRSFVRRRLWVWCAAIVAFVALFATALLTMGATTGDHTLGSVAYAQVPPNQGDHSPVWQRCGFYSEPVENEHAVHSLEHGAIWITYRPDLPQPQIEELRAQARLHADMLVSPYSDLPAPVVVSAWGRQVQLDVVDKTRLEQALTEIRTGFEAPEPGAGCAGPNMWITGATGDPEP